MLRKTLISVWMAAVFGVMVAPASAQSTLSDQPTFFTFSQPVSLPGVTLPAGRYEFRLANSLSNRHIVQVFNGDGSRILATIFAIPAERLDTPNEPEIRFMETPSAMPPAIQTWWYPGVRIGHEFIYPKKQAQILAKLNKGVLSTEGETKDGALSRVSEAGETKVAEHETTKAAVTGRPQRGELRADASAAPSTSPVAENRNAARPPMTRKALPHTASSQELVFLVGLASLAGAVLTLRRNRA
jgi:hypothetical protein